MSKRILALALLAMVAQALAPVVAGEDFYANPSPYRITRTIDSLEVDVFRFSLGSNEKADWKVTVSSGGNLEVSLVDADQVDKALAGERFKAYADQSSDSTRSIAHTWGAKGSFAIIVTTASIRSSNTTYDFQLTKRGYNANEWLNIALFGAIGLAFLAAAIFKAHSIARAIKALSPSRQVVPEPAQPAPQPSYPVGTPQSTEYACPVCGGPTLFSPQIGRYFCLRENRWL